MGKITTDFVGTENATVRISRLQSIHDYWFGNGAFVAAATLGGVRTQMNGIAPVAIADKDAFGTWMAKWNTMNDPDAAVAAVPDMEALFLDAQPGQMFQAWVGELQADDPAEPVGLWMNTPVDDLQLGSELVTLLSMTAANANSVASTVGANRVATSVGDGTFGLIATMPAGGSGKYYLVKVTRQNNLGVNLYTDLHGVTAALPPSVNESYAVIKWVNDAAFAIYVLGGTGAGRTFQVSLASVKEILNPGVLLTQASAGLRPTVVKHPVGRVRNLIDNSENFAGWGSSSVVVTTGVINDPDGNPKGDRLVVNTAAGVEHYTERTLPVAAGQYTQKLRVKRFNTSSFKMMIVHVGAGSSTTTHGINLNPSTGEVTAGSAVGSVALTASVNPLSDGWYEVVLAYDLPSGVTSHRMRIYPQNDGIYTGDGVSGIYACRASATLSTDAAKPYQKVGTTSADVTETGVASVTGIRMDQTTQKLSFAVPAARNRLVSPEDFTNAVWTKVSVTTPAASQVTYSTGGAGQALRQTIALASGQQITFRFKARSVSGNTALTLDLEDVESQSFTLTGSLQTFTWTVTPAAARARFDFQLGGAGTIEITELQMENGAAATAFEGDVVGTMILAGSGGVWAETIRTPRLVARDLGPLTVSGSSVNRGLIAAVQGPLSDPDNKILGFALYDRVLTSAEIRRIARRFKAVGGKGWLVPGPELLTNGNFASGTTGWTGFNATIANVSGELEVTLTGTYGLAGQMFSASTDDPVLITATARKVTTANAVINVPTAGLVDTSSLTAVPLSRFIATPSNPANRQVELYADGTVGQKAIFDNVSARKYSPEF